MFTYNLQKLKKMWSVKSFEIVTLYVMITFVCLRYILVNNDDDEWVFFLFFQMSQASYNNI